MKRIKGARRRPLTDRQREAMIARYRVGQMPKRARVFEPTSAGLIRTDRLDG